MTIREFKNLTEGLEPDTIILIHDPKKDDDVKVNRFDYYTDIQVLVLRHS